MTRTGFVHQALCYGSDQEFLTGTADFLRDGLDAGDVVLAVLSGHHIALLTEELGSKARDVEFADSRDWYDYPSRTLGRYHAYCRSAEQGPPRPCRRRTRLDGPHRVRDAGMDALRVPRERRLRRLRPLAPVPVRHPHPHGERPGHGTTDPSRTRPGRPLVRAQRRLRGPGGLLRAGHRRAPPGPVARRTGRHPLLPRPFGGRPPCPRRVRPPPRHVRATDVRHGGGGARGRGQRGALRRWAGRGPAAQRPRAPRL